MYIREFQGEKFSKNEYFIIYSLQIIKKQSYRFVSFEMHKQYNAPQIIFCYQDEKK
jgi:hypothetical protein